MGAVMSNTDPPRSESSTSIPLKSFSPKNQHLRPSKSVINIRDQKESNGFIRNSFTNVISMKNLSINSGSRDNNFSETSSPPHIKDSQSKGILCSAASKQRLCLEDAKNNNDFKNERLSSNSNSINNLMKSTSCFTLINEKNNHHKLLSQPNHHCRGNSVSPGHTTPHIHKRNNNHLRNSRSIDSMVSSKKYVIHASTSELLKCLGYFLFYQCPRLEKFQPNSAVVWIRAIDRSLIMQGWAEIAFINPANVVFIFMLLKDFAHDGVNSEHQLQVLTQTCLYISYAYMGNEISYPLAPFILEEDRDAFWSRCLDIINKKSSDMLKLNSDPVYFTEIFTELKSYAQNFS